MSSFDVFGKISESKISVANSLQLKSDATEPYAEESTDLAELDDL